MKNTKKRYVAEFALKQIIVLSAFLLGANGAMAAPYKSEICTPTQAAAYGCSFELQSSDPQTNTALYLVKFLKKPLGVIYYRFTALGEVVDTKTNASLGKLLVSFCPSESGCSVTPTASISSINYNDINGLRLVELQDEEGRKYRADLCGNFRDLDYNAGPSVPPQYVSTSKSDILRYVPPFYQVTHSAHQVVLQGTGSYGKIRETLNFGLNNVTGAFFATGFLENKSSGSVLFVEFTNGTSRAYSISSSYQPKELQILSNETLDARFCSRSEI